LGELLLLIRLRWRQDQGGIAVELASGGQPRRRRLWRCLWSVAEDEEELGLSWLRWAGSAGSSDGAAAETLLVCPNGGQLKNSGGCRCVRSKDERSGGRSLSGGAGKDNGGMVLFCGGLDWLVLSSAKNMERPTGDGRAVL